MRSRTVNWPPANDPHQELTDAARHALAVLSRVGERELLDVAADTATFTGTLHDLADRGVDVAVHLASGRRVHGAVRRIGRDVVVIGRADRVQVAVAARTIRSVGVASGDAASFSPARGERTDIVDVTLHGIVAEAFEFGIDLVLVAEASAEPIPGRVVGVGEDVITVEMHGPSPVVVHLPAWTIVEVHRGTG